MQTPAYKLCLVALVGAFTLPALAAPVSANPRQVAGRDLAGWRTDLDSENRTRRLRAAKTIGIFGKPAIATLEKMCEHKDPAVRYWAASHLGNIGDSAAKDSLIRQVDDRSIPVRMAVEYALARIEGPTKQPKLLLEQLRSPHRSNACCAADFLARLGPDARAHLDEIRAVHRSAKDFHVRGATKKAMRLIVASGELENHKRPTGGGPPRTWGKGKVAKGPAARTAKDAARRPNILWISCEDISPNLGCYGDTYASTPHLDRLAKEGVRYTRAFTPAGVCAINRTGMITGMYPISYGAQHMRAIVPFPDQVKCFPVYLRKAGYFCTNKSKTDYQTNVDLGEVWDRQGENHSDWRERAPGQPFFSVINLTVCHESQIRHGDATHAKLLENLQPSQRHDPEKAARHLPPIYANTPETRKDWARYHDNISEMDRQAGEILKRLAEDGLVDNTIVVFWSDHGRGLPRGKRWIYDSGVHIPVIVRWPNQLDAGTVNQELLSTLDFAPTLLALAGVPPKQYMHGRVFLGEKKQTVPEYLFFHRDRMGEAYDLIRAARSDRYKYIRNYEPERTYAQHIDYMDKMPTLVDLRRLHAKRQLDPVQSLWFRETKPIEELYDVVVDPHETNNLAGDADYAMTLTNMRAAVEKWQERVGDMGLIPEPIMMESFRAKAKSKLQRGN